MQDHAIFNTEEIVQLLVPQANGGDRFIGQSHFMGSPQLFGGQALGQALHAASMTVPERLPHSLHALFILPGNYRLPIEYQVERVRDGGSFSVRRVVGLQEGKRIFEMTASFQTTEQGLSHQKPAPPMEDPETLVSSVALWQQNKAPTTWPFHALPVDFRAARGDDLFGGNPGSPTRNIWVRAPLSLADDARVHESLFAYISDYGLLWTALQPHDIDISDPRLQLASLDHAIWFHRPFRMDEWLLFATESPNASGGRGLCLAYVYNRQGMLVATIAQEGLIRLHTENKKIAASPA